MLAQRPTPTSHVNVGEITVDQDDQVRHAHGYESSPFLMWLQLHGRRLDTGHTGQRNFGQFTGAWQASGPHRARIGFQYNAVRWRELKPNRQAGSAK
jgi:hypothetical protein